MIFRYRKHQKDTDGEPAKPKAEPKTPAPPSEIDLAKDTIAAVLRTLSEFCLPTKELAREDFQRRCEDLAGEVLVRRKTNAEAEAPRPVDEVHRDVRAAVREQRREESREYAAHRETARVVVEDLVRQMRRALRAQQRGFSEVLQQLDALEQAVASGDAEIIQETTQSAVQSIRDVIEEQSARDKERLEQLEGRVEEMRGQLEEAKAEAAIDGLTGLYNRKAGEDRLNRAVVETQIAKRPITVFIFDIDHFKNVNDEHGHAAGDEVIKAVARVLSMSFPRRDDVVVRWGGEEFLALCRDVDGEDVRNLAERAREGVELLKVPAGKVAIRPTVSVGFAELQYIGGEPELPAVLVERADVNLYEAKRSGRNRVCG